MSIDRPTCGDGDPDRFSRREDRPFPAAPADREAAPELPRNTLSMEELRAVYDRAGTLAELQAEARAYEESQAREAGSSDSSGSGSMDLDSSAEGTLEGSAPQSRQLEELAPPDRELPPFPGAPEFREPSRNTPSMEEVRALNQRTDSNAESEAVAKEHPAVTDGPDGFFGRAGALHDQSATEPGERELGERTEPGTRGSTDSPSSVQAQASSGTSEGTRVTEKVADADTPEATDKSAERVKELETELAETKGELAETKSELAEEKSDRRKLTSVVADQADEIKRLRAQLEAKGTKHDQPAGVRERDEDNGTPSETLADKTRETKVTEDEPRKRRVGLPSAEGVSLFGAVVGSGEAVGAVTHTLTTGEQGLIGAGVTLLGSGILYAKAKYDKHKEKQSDRPET